MAALLPSTPSKEIRRQCRRINSRLRHHNVSGSSQKTTKQHKNKAKLGSFLLLIAGVSLGFRLRLWVVQLVVPNGRHQPSADSAALLSVGTSNQTRSSSIPIQANSTINHHDATIITDVIVYLAQLGNRPHSSYPHRTHPTKSLNESLKLLWDNYVSRHPHCHVIVFWTLPEIEDEDSAKKDSKRQQRLLIQQQQEMLQRGRPQLQFHLLNGNNTTTSNHFWSIPRHLKTPRRRWKKYPHFSIGYRKMCRWYAVLLYEYLHHQNYTHVMRLDDDSQILSPISFNVFDYLRQNRKTYAFRQLVQEPVEPVLERFVRDYYYETNGRGNQNNSSNPHHHGIDPKRWQQWLAHKDVGFYTNWFVAEIDWFLTASKTVTSPQARLLHAIDHANLFYTHRVGDLTVSSLVIRLFMPSEQVHWFHNDFAYLHMTRKPRQGCIPYGGLSRGRGWRNGKTNKAANDTTALTYANDDDKEWQRLVQQYIDPASYAQGCKNANNGKRPLVELQSYVGAPDVGYCTPEWMTLQREQQRPEQQQQQSISTTGSSSMASRCLPVVEEYYHDAETPGCCG